MKLIHTTALTLCLSLTGAALLAQAQDLGYDSAKAQRDAQVATEAARVIYKMPKLVENEDGSYSVRSLGSSEAIVTEELSKDSITREGHLYILTLPLISGKQLRIPYVFEGSAKEALDDIKKRSLSIDVTRCMTRHNEVTSVRRVDADTCEYADYILKVDCTATTMVPTTLNYMRNQYAEIIGKGNGAVEIHIKDEFQRCVSSSLKKPFY